MHFEVFWGRIVSFESLDSQEVFGLIFGQANPEFSESRKLVCA